MLFGDFNLKDGKLFCLKYFCSFCLTKNYDISIEEVKNTFNWLCPFCCGECFCTRCIRFRRMNKMFSNFLIIGGTIEDVSNGNYFSKIYLSNLVSVQTKKETPKKIYVRFIFKYQKSLKNRYPKRRRRNRYWPRLN